VESGRSSWPPEPPPIWKVGELDVAIVLEGRSISMKSEGATMFW